MLTFLQGITCLSACVLGHNVQLLDLLLLSGADPAVGGTNVSLPCLDVREFSTASAHHMTCPMVCE